MRAALFEAVDQPITIVDDIEIAEPGPGEVRVQVTHCGVCHSDFSNVNGTFPIPGPIVLGHEAAGVVERVGAGVTSLAPGDHVVLSPIAVCGECYGCVRGEYGTCVNASAISTGTFVSGSTGLARNSATVYRGLGVGGFAEYALRGRRRRDQDRRRHSARRGLRDRLLGANRCGRSAERGSAWSPVPRCS